MNKRFKPIFSVILIALCISFSSGYPGDRANAQDSLAEAISQFEEFVEVRMIQDKVPGLSVAFKRGDFTWAKGFGYSDLENKVPAKPESAYRLASITKSITATAVLKLVEEGKIDLEAEVQTYVPGFPRKKWPVTVRLLLGHLGGISHYKNYDVEGRIKVHKDTIEALAIFQDFDLVAEPGTQYNYSSYGYNLLGAVVEGASGESYGSYIQKHIFEPLGMTHSRLDDPMDLIPHRVRGYRIINGEIKNSEYVDVSSRFAGGGTRSTVVDLLKYASGIMDKKILKEETWDMMFTSMTTREGRFTGYGMGWRVRPWKGHFQVSHGGSQPETRTHILIFPKEGFAMAIASNREGLNLMPYVRRLAELVLAEDLDSSVYVTDEPGQAIYDCCEDVFSYGLSRFDWHGREIIGEEKDLAKAFSYFNRNVKKSALEKNIKAGKKTIDEGFNPVSNSAFIKIGAFMALTLQENLGENKFRSYHQSGPLAFFTDYIEVSSQWPSSKDVFKFTQSFIDMISAWEKEWSSVYADDVRNLFITTRTDFGELGPRLIKIFSRASLYPDFSRELGEAGLYHLWNNETEISFPIFKLCYELYPRSPASVSNLGTAHLWQGNVDEARKYFKEAFAADPNHSSVSLDHFSRIAVRLERAEKLEVVFALADIALELYPRNAELHLEVGNMHSKTGNLDKARSFYKKALELDPKLEDARKKLREIKKRK